MTDAQIIATAVLAALGGFFFGKVWESNKWFRLYQILNEQAAATGARLDVLEKLAARISKAEVPK